MGKLKFSKRIKSMSYSPIRSIVPFLNEAKGRGLKVYEMHIGQPNIETPDTFFDIIHNYNDRIVKYADSRGVAELIHAFLTFYNSLNMNIVAEDILVTQGGSEALLFAIQTICDPKDEIMVFEPYYTNYDSFIKMCSAKFVPVTLHQGNGFAIPTLAQLQKKKTKKTKAILFSNPNNPLGTIMSESEMQTIADFAKKNNLYIIADEVYRKFTYDGIDHKSFMNIPEIEQNVILVDSLSKHYSACGARIGTLVSKNKNFMAEALKLCQARLSVSTIEQLASVGLLSTISQYEKFVRDEYQKRRDVFCEALGKIKGVKFTVPTSAFYLFADLPVENVSEFVRWMLTEFDYEGKTISLAPGEGFYYTPDLGKDQARFSFCANTAEELAEAGEVLKIAIEKYNNIG